MTVKKQEVNWKVLVAAIAGLTIIEVIALLKGINGTMLAIMIAAIAGLAGLSIPTPKELMK